MRVEIEFFESSALSRRLLNLLLVTHTASQPRSRVYLISNSCSEAFLVLKVQRPLPSIPTIEMDIIVVPRVTKGSECVVGIEVAGFSEGSAVAPGRLGRELVAELLLGFLTGNIEDGYNA